MTGANTPTTMWSGEFVCSACGHREPAEVKGLHGRNYDGRRPADMEGIAQGVLDLVPCPKCGRRGRRFAFLVGYAFALVLFVAIVTTIFGTGKLAGILGPFAAPVCIAWVAGSLGFVVVRSLRSARSRVTFLSRAPTP